MRGRRLRCALMRRSASLWRCLSPRPVAVAQAPNFTWTEIPAPYACAPPTRHFAPRPRPWDGERLVIRSDTRLPTSTASMGTARPSSGTARRRSRLRRWPFPAAHQRSTRPRAQTCRRRPADGGAPTSSALTFNEPLGRRQRCSWHPMPTGWRRRVTASGGFGGGGGGGGRNRVDGACGIASEPYSRIEPRARSETSSHASARAPVSRGYREPCDEPRSDDR